MSSGFDGAWHFASSLKDKLLSGIKEISNSAGAQRLGSSISSGVSTIVAAASNVGSAIIDSVSVDSSVHSVDIPYDIIPYVKKNIDQRYVGSCSFRDNILLENGMIEKGSLLLSINTVSIDGLSLNDVMQMLERLSDRRVLRVEYSKAHQSQAQQSVSQLAERKLSIILSLLLFLSSNYHHILLPKYRHQEVEIANEQKVDLPAEGLASLPQYDSLKEISRQISSLEHISHLSASQVSTLSTSITNTLMSNAQLIVMDYLLDSSSFTDCLAADFALTNILRSTSTSPSIPSLAVNRWDSLTHHVPSDLDNLVTSIHTPRLGSALALIHYSSFLFKKYGILPSASVFSMVLSDIGSSLVKSLVVCWDSVENTPKMMWLVAVVMETLVMKQFSLDYLFLSDACGPGDSASKNPENQENVSKLYYLLDPLEHKSDVICTIMSNPLCSIDVLCDYLIAFIGKIRFGIIPMWAHPIIAQWSGTVYGFSLIQTLRNLVWLFPSSNRKILFFFILAFQRVDLSNEVVIGNAIRLLFGKHSSSLDGSFGSFLRSLSYNFEFVFGIQHASDAVIDEYDPRTHLSPLPIHEPKSVVVDPSPELIQLGDVLQSDVTSGTLQQMSQDGSELNTEDTVGDTSDSSDSNSHPQADNASIQDELHANQGNNEPSDMGEDACTTTSSSSTNNEHGSSVTGESVMECSVSTPPTTDESIEKKTSSVIDVNVDTPVGISNSDIHSCDGRVEEAKSPSGGGDAMGEDDWLMHAECQLVLSVHDSCSFSLDSDFASVHALARQPPSLEHFHHCNYCNLYSLYSSAVTAPSNLVCVDVVSTIEFNEPQNITRAFTLDRSIKPSPVSLSSSDTLSSKSQLSPVVQDSDVVPLPLVPPNSPVSPMTTLISSSSTLDSSPPSLDSHSVTDTPSVSQVPVIVLSKTLPQHDTKPQTNTLDDALARLCEDDSVSDSYSFATSPRTAPRDSLTTDYPMQMANNSVSVQPQQPQQPQSPFHSLESAIDGLFSSAGSFAMNPLSGGSNPLQQQHHRSLESVTDANSLTPTTTPPPLPSRKPSSSSSSSSSRQQNSSPPPVLPSRKHKPHSKY